MNSFFLNRLLLTLLLLVAMGEMVLAQPTTGGPTPGTPVGPTNIPLDGGISLLLAGGVAYGIKHLKNRRKKA